MPSRRNKMEKPDNCTIVIFGASGDLTQRKLIPALFDSYVQGLLPKDFAILGVSRTDFTDEAFRKHLEEGITEHAEKEGHENQIGEFLKTAYYQAIDTAVPEEYAKVKEKLSTIDKTCHTKDNYLFYLSTPPKLYSVIADALKLQELTKESSKTGWRRIIVEKPFGYDLESAQ
ncbi:glucose-6-phosphate dehydrogenase, partial [bacterium]